MSAIGCGMKKGGFYLTKKPLTSLHLRTYNPEYPNIMSKNAEFKNKNWPAFETFPKINTLPSSELNHMPSTQSDSFYCEKSIGNTNWHIYIFVN